MDQDLARYARQMRFAGIGEQGQRRLAAGTALVCGCGALGSVIAEQLVRAGVGRVRLVDRDYLELNNLQRQVLYDEHDVAAQLPKAEAAAAKLRRINSQVVIEPHVADIEPGNIRQLAAGADVIVDGTDNFESRFLINDLAVEQGVPWVYGGCLGAEGQTMTILPGETPCLRCVMPEPPEPGLSPTCDTAGIVAPIIGVIASIEAAEALKLLSGARAEVSRTLTIIDLWECRVRQVKLDSLRGQADCPCCGRREFAWLSGQRASQGAVLCGRNAVQVSPAGRGGLVLDEWAAKLAGVGQLTRNKYLARLAVDKYLITVFPDGRAIIAGTDDVSEARSVYARYVGM